MNKRIFTKEQIDELLKNINVSACSEKSITFTKDFKLLAVNKYEQGLTSTEIFKEAGIDPDLIGRNQPHESMSRWRKLFEAKGEDGFSEKRGKNSTGRPRTKGITEADRIKRLEAENAYLRAENDFLIKLRAKKAESNLGRNRNISS